LKGNSHMELAQLWPQVIEKAHHWLWEQRDLHRAKGRRLTDDERLPLQDYYDTQILDTVRVATADRISNPPFYDELTESGFPILDLSGSAGITFVDCVVIRRMFQQHFPSWISILFHELVHVVQFEVLGSRKVLEAYLEAWEQNGYQYHDVPFEIQAYKLEAIFKRHERLFSVREVVEQELKGMV
jgi:hypothetical protein